MSYIMAHEVETLVSVVNAAASPAKNRTVPWHGLGVQVDSTLDDAGVLEAAGLDWTVSLHDTYTINPVTGLYVPVPKNKAVIRSTDGAVLGRVGDVYAPFQNHEIIEFGSTLVDDFGAKWDTAGALKGGAVTFASFRLDDVSGVKVGGVESENLDTYLLVTNAHDGSRAFRAAVVPIRVVCQNTLQFALSSQKASWSLRHTGTLKTRVEDARKSLDLTVDYLEEFQKIAERLADVEHTVDDLDAFIEEWVPLPEKRGVDAALANREGLKANVLGSPTIPQDLRLTSWGILQGVTEWAEHEREQRPDKRTALNERRLVSTLFNGPVQQLRDRAFATLNV